jgi:hypothetical protein
MARGNRTSRPAQRAENYKHSESTNPMRPDVGTQAQFKKKKPPVTYRYDSSLSPLRYVPTNRSCTRSSTRISPRRSSRRFFACLCLPLRPDKEIANRVINPRQPGTKRKFPLIDLESAVRLNVSEPRTPRLIAAPVDAKRPRERQFAKRCASCLAQSMRILYL